MPAHFMSNAQIAQVFFNIADMLEIKGENRFRVLAYRRAAEQIVQHPVAFVDLWESDPKSLEEIPGIGETISAKIDELLRTGKLQFYEDLQLEIPASVVALVKVPGIGPKTAKLLYQELGITSLGDLRDAAEAGKIRSLPGMSAKTETNVLKGLDTLARLSGRIPLRLALPTANALLEGLRKSPLVLQAEAAGSLRRRRITVGDIDLLVASQDPVAVIEYFTLLPQVSQVESKGETKTTVLLHTGLTADLIVLPPTSYGALLQHFTGSKDHNVELRELARNKGLSLSERGFTDEKGQLHPCATEQEVYSRLGLDFIPPELREGRGEIEAAAHHRLPHLVTLQDVRGDLQMHSTWSDGAKSVAEMAQAALAKGYAYIAITDHSQGLGVANGLTPERLDAQRAEIDALNKELAPFRILAGCEVDIHADGSLDLPDETLAKLDIVLVSIHSAMKQSREAMTERVIRALGNRHVDIFAHPSARLVGEREAVDWDFPQILRAAQQHGVMLEMNADPHRLDLDGEAARLAIQAGLTLTFGTDAHDPAGLDNMSFGIDQAHRGWVEPQHVFNTRPLEQILAHLQARR
ncbi:MAG: DNA polymerase/3'-5' exonuclease PolX [Chloroflexi bacterium]|nr:DNA polymerase/3'-5' exonuclease PolX [Chloroflexota bacterium]